MWLEEMQEGEDTNRGAGQEMTTDLGIPDGACFLPRSWEQRNLTGGPIAGALCRAKAANEHAPRSLISQSDAGSVSFGSQSGE